MADRLGIAASPRMRRFGEMALKLDQARALAKSVTLTPNEAARHGLEINKDGVRRSAYELLAHPGVDMAWLSRVEPRFAALDAKTTERLETEAKYSVYLDRQQADAAQIRHEESRLIPDSIDFSDVPGLSNELKQKMKARQPRSIADAQRMEGMTPAALAIIVAHVRNAELAARRDVA